MGLQSGKSDPTPGSLLTSGNNPGTSGWGAIAGYYKGMLGPANMRPAELEGNLSIYAMMRILSGDAAGAASRMSPGGGSAMSSYEQMVQIDGWQRQWRRYQRNRSENILDAFYQFVYSIDNGYDIRDEYNNIIMTVLDEQVVSGYQYKVSNQQTNWYGPGGQVNWFLGAVGTGVENTTGSFRLTNGAYNGSAWSPKYYASGWRGGSKARITTYRITKIGYSIGWLSVGIGIAMDLYGINEYYKDSSSPNAVHPSKAVLNTGMGAYGMFIHPVPTMFYFGIDNFYPGGWLGNEDGPGALPVFDQVHNSNQEILGPNWRVIPYNKL